nr:glycosyltransferase family 92 [Tanacetum cinerariifolium]
MNYATLIVNDEVIQASLSARKEKRAVSPSGSVGSGGDRLKKKRKPLDDEFLEGEGIERVFNQEDDDSVIFRFGSKKKKEKKIDKLRKWVEGIWEGNSYGYSQLSANGNSGGIILIWDTRVFTCMEAVGDERSVAIKGSWNGKEAWKKEVRSARLYCRFRDRNVKESLRVWSKDRFVGNKEKIEMLKNEAMIWELEAKKRTLSEVESNVA